MEFFRFCPSVLKKRVKTITASEIRLANAAKKPVARSPLRCRALPRPSWCSRVLARRAASHPQAACGVGGRGCRGDALAPGLIHASLGAPEAKLPRGITLRLHGSLPRCSRLTPSVPKRRERLPVRPSPAGRSTVRQPGCALATDSRTADRASLLGHSLRCGPLICRRSGRRCRSGLRDLNRTRPSPGWSLPVQDDRFQSVLSWEDCSFSPIRQASALWQGEPGSAQGQRRVSPRRRPASEGLRGVRGAGVNLPYALEYY